VSTSIEQETQEMGSFNSKDEDKGELNYDPNYEGNFSIELDQVSSREKKLQEEFEKLKSELHNYEMQTGKMMKRISNGKLLLIQQKMLDTVAQNADIKINFKDIVHMLKTMSIEEGKRMEHGLYKSHADGHKSRQEDDDEEEYQ